MLVSQAPSRKRFRAVSTAIPTVGTMAASVVRTTGSRRPVDKVLISVLKDAVNATQQNTTLVTATFPCTIVGLRWNIGVCTDAGAAPAALSWAIVKVQQGETTNNLSLGDATTLYAPEQNVMVWGTGVFSTFAAGNDQSIFSGETKTMRKMMGGDLLRFIVKGVATNTCKVQGTIQFFCKT